MWARCLSFSYSNNNYVDATAEENEVQMGSRVNLCINTR